MKKFDINTPTKPGFRRIKVNDRTKQTLKNGKVIPTWSAMVALAAKI